MDCNMKRYSLLFVTILIVLLMGLCACGQRSDSTPAATTAPAPTEATSKPNEAAPTSPEPTQPTTQNDNIVDTPPVNDVSTNTFREVKYELSRQTDYMAGGFSEGRAWIVYRDADNELCHGVMDTDGNLIFTIRDSDYMDFLGCDRESTFSNSLFIDGTSCFFPSHQFVFPRPGFAIIDADGNILYKPENTDEEKYYYMGYGEGYFLVGKTVKNFSENASYVYAIDKYGNVLIDPIEVKRFYNYTDRTPADTLYAYVGNGQFLPYYDGKAICIRNGVLSVESDLPIEKAWQYGGLQACLDPAYCDGNHVFDVYGNSIIDLTELKTKINIQRMGICNGGYMPLLAKGADKNNYILLINRNAEIQYEPIKVKSAPLSNRDRINITTKGFTLVTVENGNYAIATPNGEIRSIGDDLTDMGNDAILYKSDQSSGQDLLLSEGYFNGCNQLWSGALNNTYVSLDGAKTIDSVILTSETKSPYGISGIDSETGNEDTSQTSKDYMNLSTFSIEGKWKNVGTSTYGQVQSGAIVAFDGTHCNVVSPQDTYAFYKSGDNWRLDCTTLLGETLSFTVKTVDENNIDIFFGADHLELQRIG